MKVRNYHGSSCVWFIVNVIPDVKSSLRRLKLVWTWQKKTFFPQGLQCQLLQTADMLRLQCVCCDNCKGLVRFQYKNHLVKAFFHAISPYTFTPTVNIMPQKGTDRQTKENLDSWHWLTHLFADGYSHISCYSSCPRCIKDNLQS